MALIPKESVQKKQTPVILLVDVSVSMQGQGIMQANEGLRNFIDDLQRDESLKDSVSLSLVTFSSEAKRLIDFEPIANVSAPILVPEGGTLPETGLLEVMALVDDHADKMKGAKEPLFCLISDGNPNNNEWERVLEQFNTHPFVGVSPNSKRRCGFRLICGAGNDIDDTVLQKFAHDPEKTQVVRIADVQNLDQFFIFLKTITYEVSEGRELSTPASDDSIINPVNEY